MTRCLPGAGARAVPVSSILVDVGLVVLVQMEGPISRAQEQKKVVKSPLTEVQEEPLEGIIPGNVPGGRTARCSPAGNLVPAWGN